MTFPRTYRVIGQLLAVIAVFVLSATPSPARDELIAPTDPPAVATGVAALLNAPYLTAEELKDKRIFFGQWHKDDIDTPARAARAALLRGVYNDPAFDSPDAEPMDRAEAAIERGEANAGLLLLEGNTSIRAVRLRTAALEQLGRFGEIEAAGQPALDAFVGGANSTPEDVVNAAMVVLQRVRLFGPAKDASGKIVGGATDYHALMSTLGSVRTNMDNLYWPANLAEAQLLYSKDNKPKAQEALIEVLSMNPSCAKAWALLGRMTVDGFQFDQTQQVVARLDVIAAAGYDAESDGEGERGVSVHGAGILARAMLRQIDGAGALDALAPGLMLQPRNPELLALQAAAESVKFDVAATKDRLRAYDDLFPRSALAYMYVGKALAEARQYEMAMPYLDEAVRRAPLWAEPLIERGLMQVQAAHDEDALATLERAFELDPFHTRADNSLRLVREMRAYAKIDTPHFIIRYKPVPEGTPAPDELLAREMPEILEANYRVVTGSQPGGIDHTLSGGLKTYIDLMPDHQWFGVRMVGMPQVHTIAASTGPLIAMESPRDGPGHMGTYDWARVVRHEYVHTVTLSRSNNRIPHWFTEASAVYLELAPREYQTCQMLARAVDTDELFDFTYINVAFTRPKRPNDRGMAYSQGEWMYSYMIETHGNRSPHALMDEYAKGVREEAAFLSVLGVSREQFFESFKVWAKEQCIAWGLLLPKGVPSVRELMEGAAPLGEAPPKAPTREMIDGWLTAHPEHPDVLELAVDEGVRRAGGKVTMELAPLLERYAKARPVDPKPHRLLAKMYLDLASAAPDELGTHASEAIPHLEFLDAREQKTPAYAVELAKRYASLGDYEKAKAAGVRATRIAPFVAGPREVLATVAVQAKDYEMAERQLRALVLIEPDREIHKRRLDALAKMRVKDGR